MAGRVKATPPASKPEMARRIKQVLGLLPMSERELRYQTVLHPEDDALFDFAFDEARKAGEVVRDPQRRDWFRRA